MAVGRGNYRYLVNWGPFPQPHGPKHLGYFVLPFPVWQGGQFYLFYYNSGHDLPRNPRTGCPLPDQVLALEWMKGKAKSAEQPMATTPQVLLGAELDFTILLSNREESVSFILEESTST